MVPANGPAVDMCNDSCNEMDLEVARWKGLSCDVIQDSLCDGSNLWWLLQTLLEWLDRGILNGLAIAYASILEIHCLFESVRAFEMVPMLVPGMDLKVCVMVLLTGWLNEFVIVLAMALSRVLETNWMLECVRGLVMLSRMVSAMDLM